MLGNLIGGFVTIVVGVNLLPVVADQVWLTTVNWNSTNSSWNCGESGNAACTNVTGASVTILQLTTLFFALGIVASGISVAAQGLRSAGLLGI
jgi:hypothetical protein